MATIADIIYGKEFQAKELVLSLKLVAPKHIIHADPGRMQQVLWNLLKNAIKFSNDGGKIEIETANENDHVYLHIRDNGMGMSAQTLGYTIFRPFRARF